MTTALRLDGETRLFLIVGHPTAQVKSPAALSAILARRGQNALVVPADVRPDDLARVIDAAQATLNVDGIVVTVPHKGAALAHCARVTDRAKAAGAVNVMVRDGDGWAGDATDGQGCLGAVAAQGFDVRGRRALLVGTGGAGAAIAWEILARGAAHLDVHDIDATRRDRLIGVLEAGFPGRVGIGSPDPRGYDYIANATPLGMRPDDPLPVDVAGLSAGQFVSDVVTHPAVPALIAAARERGCGTATGSAMFEAQAELLVDILTGRQPVMQDNQKDV